MARLHVGTSGWHYNDWRGLFYPPDITGYNELRYYAEHFMTVENNSSFYRIAGESTYKTWNRMTPPDFTFSIKLNKLITHTHRLEITDDVRKAVAHILSTTNVLEYKKGVILIQLPASFHLDLNRLRTFLEFFTTEVRAQPQPFDIAIEFRHKDWFVTETYGLLRDKNVALVAAQSSRWPGEGQLTADIAYIRMHGPEKLFASSYTSEQLAELRKYMQSISARVRHIYVYFNNDFHGYALENARELATLCS